MAFDSEGVPSTEDQEAMYKMMRSHLSLVASDLAASGVISFSDVQDAEMQFFGICRDTFRMAREKGLKCGLGGAISERSVGFIRRLSTEGLLDKFETRKVVFSADAVEHGPRIFRAALDFELQWLKSKRRFYSGVRREDEARIAMLEQRLGASRE